MVGHLWNNIYVPQLGALSHPFFGWEGSPTKIDYRKKATEKLGAVGDVQLPGAASGEALGHWLGLLLVPLCAPRRTTRFRGNDRNDRADEAVELMWIDGADGK